MTIDDLERIFTYHAPTPDQIDRYRALRVLARQFARAIVELSPASREQSLAISHVQEAVMCVNAAIAIHEATEVPHVEKA
jgi:hypothetical protein